MFRYILCTLLLNSVGSFTPAIPRFNKNIKCRHLSLLSNEFIELEKSLTVNSLIASTNIITNNKSLTKEGLLNAWILGNILWVGYGLEGWLTGLIYFIMGSLVTKIKMKEKEELGIAEKRSGARGPENVWGSAATATICVLISLSELYNEFDDVIKLAFITSFATKLSDTFASEIGKAYGKNCYLITNFKKVERGTEGAISVEGTLAGIIGSLIIALYGSYSNQISYEDIYIVMLSAFIATNCESVLGVVLQDKQKWITNEFVNFLNTTIGALVSILIKMISF
tara:strand:+ start:2117 stop:2965 length:849 start_codon:yes stop_codon:yes gene_type:complete